MFKRGLRIVLAAMVAATPAMSDAHSLWIEQDEVGAKMYFGEFGENLREASPGRLDKFVKPVAVHVSARGEKDVAVVKSSRAFVLEARAGKGESVVAYETASAISEAKGDGKPLRKLSVPAARFVSDWSAQKPKLALDVVPTGRAVEGGAELAVSYGGKPLAGTEAHVIAQSGWERSIKTDPEGRITVGLPWQGAYVVEVRHTDASAGTRKVEKDGATVEEPYDVASYVTTLSFVTASGLPSPPAPPSAEPKR
jgi:hypothetical protein